MMLEQALAHKWVLGESTSNEKVSEDVIRVLRQFNQQSKLKKAITKTLAANMGAEPEKKIKEHFDRLDKNGDNALDAGVPLLQKETHGSCRKSCPPWRCCRSRCWSRSIYHFSQDCLRPWIGRHSQRC